MIEIFSSIATQIAAEKLYKLCLPIKFVENNKCLYNYGSEYWKPYFHHMKKLEKVRDSKKKRIELIKRKIERVAGYRNKGEVEQYFDLIDEPSYLSNYLIY